MWRRSYTGSTWRTVVDSMAKDATRRNGDGDTAPRVSNAEAVALVEELRLIGKQLSVPFPGWEGLEAIAYGFDGGDLMYADEIQRDSMYPDEWASVLWEMSRGMADEFDRHDKAAGARRVNPEEESWAAGVLNVQREVAKKECRVPLPGVPPDQWPTCKAVWEAIKKKLPAPGKVAPVLPVIVALKRLVPIVIGVIVAGWLLDNNQER